MEVRSNMKVNWQSYWNDIASQERNIMDTEKRDFDKEAASWDEHPPRVKLAKDIAGAITKQIVLTPEMDVMDFGCGTGLLTLQILPLVRSITGVDSSRGMLDVLNTKIAEQKLKNIETLLVDLDKGDTLEGKYDLVFSNMTLHHVREIEPLFDQFHKITAPGGHLCVADLDLDGGQFHADKTGVFHFGFARKALRKVFTGAGFDDVRDMSAAEVMKTDINGKTKSYSVFLMTGRKRPDQDSSFT